MDETDATPTLESRFLAVVGESPVPAGECLDLLREAMEGGQANLALQLAMLLRERLVETADAPGLVDLFTLWSGWAELDAAFAGSAFADLRRASKDRLFLACVESCGFGTIRFAESMRRLGVLLACTPGTVCLDRTWGAGVIRRMDDFYKRAVIDFSTKKNHALTFAYAAEALEIPPEDHILVKFLKDRDAYVEKIDTRPGEVVRDMLSSFGDMSAMRLETLLAEHGIVPLAGRKTPAPAGSGKDGKVSRPSDGWKRFWDAARKALKGDELVEIPAKRSDPIVLHAQPPKVGDNTWYSAFASLRDPEKILEQVLVLEAKAEETLAGEAARETVANRLAFALTGARNIDHPLYARLAVATARLGIEIPRDPPASEEAEAPVAEAPRSTADRLRDQLWQEKRYLQAAGKLSARDVGQLVTFLVDGDDEARAHLLDDLESMNYAMASEVLDRFRRKDPGYAARLRLRDLLSRPTPPPTVLVWVLRNLWTLRDRESLRSIDGWMLPSNYELLGAALSLFENANLSGESLRMRNAVEGLLSRTGGRKEAEGDWFRGIFATLPELQQEAIFDRVRSSSWDPAMQRGIIGRMIKENAALKVRKAHDVAPGDRPDPSRPADRWTSTRSRIEREQVLEHLVKVEIPENVKAIVEAKAYGDLSENFEYQSAKDNERILNQRRDTLEEELRGVRATDFAECAPVAAGMGSRVTLRTADGTTHVCTILGEWDHDEALRIYSNKSGLALSLEGHKPGDDVTVPSEEGDVSATVVAVEPIDDAVRAWIRAIPAGMDEPANPVAPEA
ncbi:MAG: GreA/GreB family elongation factor [Kiritimatiellia bacterium]|jgi:transcription elongation GreA/GreB family factor